MKLYIVDNDPNKIPVSEQDFIDLETRVSSLESSNNNQGNIESFTSEWKNKVNSISKTRIVTKGSISPTNPLSGDLWWSDSQDGGGLYRYENGWVSANDDQNISNYLYISSDDNTLYRYINNTMIPIGSTILEDSDCIFEIKDENDNSIFQVVDGHVVTLNFDSRKLKKEVKVLSIGDKRTVEAFAYVPQLLENMGMDVTLGILYSNVDFSLEDFYYYLLNGYEEDDGQNHVFTNLYTYTTEKGNWINEVISVPSYIDNLITYTDWDIIVLQRDTSDLSNYGLNLDMIIRDIGLRLSKGVKIGWLIETPAVNDNTSPATTISDTLTNYFYKYAIDFIIPCGTAISIMRIEYPSDANIGDNGNLTYNNDFLQDGLPRLIEAYTAASTIATIYGHGEKGIVGDDFIPDKNWILNSNIPLQRGNPVGLTPEKRIIGQMCAVKAIRACSSSDAAESLFPNN